MKLKALHWVSVVDRGILAAATAVILFTWGCGGGADSGARTYTLKLPDPPSSGPAPSRWIIGVESFSAAQPLNDWRILKYESPTQLKYYDDDHWVSQPATMIPELAARYLERMGIARQAGVMPYVEKMDYILQGQILNFEEFESRDKHEARVALELTLVRFPNREVVWTGTFRSEQPVTGGDAPDAVEALSLATHNALKDGLTQLAETLRREPQASN